MLGLRLEAAPLAPLEGETIALVALAIAFGFVLASRAVAAMLAPALPGFLQFVPNAIIAAADRALVGLNSAIDADINTLAQTWNWIYQHGYAWLIQDVQAIAAIRDALYRVVNVSIPRAAAGLLLQLQAAYLAALAYAHGLYLAAESDLAATRAGLVAMLGNVEAGLYASILEAYERGAAYTRALVSAEGSLLGQMIAGAEQRAARELSQEAGRAEAAERAVAAYAGQAAGQAIGYTEQVGAALEQQLAGGVSALERQIAQSYAQATAYAAAIGLVAEGEIQAVRNSRCMQQCDTLGAIGEFVNGLDVGLLLGFVAYARSNPEAAVAFMRQQVAPALKAIGSDVEGLIGG